MAIKRRKTKSVKIGTITIGSGRPVVIQSMIKVDTKDTSRVVLQIKRLVKGGCQLVRVAVPTRADTKAFAKIVEKVNVPLIADVHFNANRAVEAIEAGAAKIRLNPGNIKKREDILRVIDAAKMQRVAIRIGVNEASIRDLKKSDVPLEKRCIFMLKEMKKYVSLFESRGFGQLVLSAKSADPLRTIEINRLIADNFNYPVHLGLTHAGLPEDARFSSAVTIGTLLAEGIGDTVRVSVAGDPVKEVEIAKQILISLGLLERKKPELIVCPTCGRTQVDVIKLAKEIKKAIVKVNNPLRIAVMGCIVNGPGEAVDADLAICAGKGKASLYRKGKKLSVVRESTIKAELLKQIKKLK